MLDTQTAALGLKQVLGESVCSSESGQLERKTVGPCSNFSVCACVCMYVYVREPSTLILQRLFSVGAILNQQPNMQALPKLKHWLLPPLGYLAMGKNVFSQINDMFIQKEVAALFLKFCCFQG